MNITDDSLLDEEGYGQRPNRRGLRDEPSDLSHQTVARRRAAISLFRTPCAVSLGRRACLGVFAAFRAGDQYIRSDGRA